MNVKCNRQMTEPKSPKKNEEKSWPKFCFLLIIDWNLVNKQFLLEYIWNKFEMSE